MLKSIFGYHRKILRPPSSLNQITKSRCVIIATASRNKYISVSWDSRKAEINLNREKWSYLTDKNMFSCISFWEYPSPLFHDLYCTRGRNHHNNKIWAKYKISVSPGIFLSRFATFGNKFRIFLCISASLFSHFFFCKLPWNLE